MRCFNNMRSRPIPQPNGRTRAQTAPGNKAQSRFSWRSQRSAAAILLLFLSLRLVFAAGPVVHTSLKSASEAAAADQSLVMVVFSATWCAPCQQLKQKTLASKEFIEQGGALHLVELDVDSERNAARDFAVEEVPTLLALTPDNKIISRHEGFVETAELLLWLRDARERAKAGKWEGTVAGSKLSEFAAKSAADQLTTNDLALLVGMLGASNPADREAAARLLVEQREQAVLLLIEALTNSYLGVRIAASEALQHWAPETLLTDPWQAPAELADAVAALRKWWNATGKLPSQRTASQAAPSSVPSIARALEELRGNNPVKRTEAMSALVGSGAPALPSVRQAIRLAEKSGDQRSVSLLEDVRWAILVPDGVEQRAEGVRNALARGKGTERQNAAARLGRAGRSAIPALIELAEDADPLVVEGAVRALSSVGGADALPAMSALLKVGDSNLRMTAAQSLGHTRNPAAVTDLLTVLNDANEVVACAALSALDEISGERDYSPSKKPQAPEVIRGLRDCLKDSRWRVRAAAAEVTGKIGVKELIPELNLLLADADGFVVKGVLEALKKLSAAPEPEKLLAVAQRHLGLRGEAVELLVNWGGEDAVEAVTRLYNASDVEGRIAILRSLGPGRERNPETNAWQPLLSQAAAASDPRLRRCIADTLAAQPPRVAAGLIGPLLSDADDETRSKAAGVVLAVVSGERQVNAGSHGAQITEFVLNGEIENPLDSLSKKTSATNQPPATAEQIAAWHVALQKAAKRPELLTSVAVYVTGSSNAELPALQEAFGRSDNAGLIKLRRSAAVAALIPRLPWPDGKPIIERLCGHPALFLQMIARAPQASPGLSDFLFEPERFRTAVDPASADDLQASLERLLGSRQTSWSLFSASARTEKLVAALLQASNSVWRAAATYSLGRRSDSAAQGHLERALQDTNGWVRAAAVSGLTRTVKDRPTLERLLSPLLEDRDKRVAELAATGLLEPETRSAAGLEYSSGYFQFEKIHVWTSYYDRSNEQRPLAVLQGNPSFLETARRKAASSSPDEASLPTLLMAQYGDFSGLEHLLKLMTAENQADLQSIVQAAIGLSRDAKYLPHLKKMLASAKDEQDYRRLLQALRGMTGSEARELRLEINKRMRRGNE